MEILMVYPRQENSIQDEKFFTEISEAQEYLRYQAHEDELTIGIFTLVKTVKLKKKIVVEIIQEK